MSLTEAVARQALLNRDMKYAREWAKERGCTIRIVENDGRGLVVKTDFRPQRINVRLYRGLVTGVLGFF
jgi:hypothetical protein